MTPAPSASSRTARAWPSITAACSGARALSLASPGSAHTGGAIRGLDRDLRRFALELEEEDGRGNGGARRR